MPTTRTKLVIETGNMSGKEGGYNSTETEREEKKGDV
jgi:hypothetical protein